MSKVRVGIIFGGKSAEHEVSLQSAINIIEAIDKEKYEIVLIGVDKEGKWYLIEDSNVLLNSDDPKLIKLNRSDKPLALIMGENSNQLLSIKDNKTLGKIDVVFPVLHGPYGEDGTVQGLLKLANIPFVGADVLGSAVGMDKDVMKRLLRDSGIPIAKFLVYENEDTDIDYKYVKKELGMPVFIKPANLGSSVGISKAKNKKEFDKAIRLAFEYDTKIIIEENIIGREIECSVLGNTEPIASLPGEILPSDDFYSYEAKYIDEKGARLQIPAEFSKKQIKRIQECSIKSFKALACKGMARLDVFVKENDEIVVNEINTIPGFTRISMYPKLWEVSGIDYTELIDMLIQFALSRFNNEKKLKTSL
ncbi:D-alanine--D-alanine ligase [Clostridium sp. D2Q-14]|uniref:D-alanine--D-alanine ligase n=1 Tax=Anaeromonas gelatinilytica TaxID=2683194 RepID=UPI00193C017E|nr:D-alanine--D-alanine ligase [Anaeromonas gelatinilytica]MBS4534332.1 D-alanine--D-alanine ligase [Anaeromonas gelatinilytica]